MKNPFAKLLSMLFSVLLIIDYIQAQPFYIERGQVMYLETEDQIYKLNRVIKYEDFKKLLAPIVPSNFDSLSNSPFEYKDAKYRVAGFCFIPIWDIPDQEDVRNESEASSIKEFRTVGIRVVPALWKVTKNNVCDNVIMDSEQMIIPEFGVIQNAMEPLQGIYKRLENKNTIDLRFEESELIEYEGQELVRLQEKTREFDFVFLEYERFIDLATNSRFYPNKQRPRGLKGITIERSLVSYDTTSISNQQSEFFAENYRSLTFRPYPIPVITDREGAITVSATAFEEGKRCPPYWWNLRDPHRTLTEFYCEEPAQEKYVIVENKSRFKLPFGLGRTMPLETFSEQYNPGQYLEISVSTRLATFVRYRRSDLNLQLIVDGGIYAFEDPHRTDRDYNIWGIGLGPRLEYEYTLGFSESTVYRYGADFAILKAISIGIYGDVKAGGYRPDDLGWINGWNYGVGIFARFGALSINLGNRIFMLDDNIDFSTYGVSIGIGL